ncbi:molybdate transport repressor ModE-like protein [Anaerotaenia torta]|uniref:NTP transferase domain-containing protein n=1 Tax=Anaerotaenia torta TaxID=433293 RepID=UPI003D1A07F9
MLDNADRTAGIISAAKKIIRKEQTSSLLQIGSISAIKRIVLTFQVAGIDPVVIITGFDSEEIERELCDYGVIFLHKEHYEQSQLFHLAKIGLEYLRDKCDKVMFTPVDIPLFSPDTLKKMMACSAKAVSPVYQHRIGHPTLVSSDIIPLLLDYEGEGGMPGALAEAGVRRQFLEVEDAGIIEDFDPLEHKSELIRKHNTDIFHPYVRLSLEKESLFFDAKTKLLLTLIHETSSVKSACKAMALSYSKAWHMLNALEEAVQYKVITRQQGGNRGGKTCLTREGGKLLRDFELFEQRVKNFTQEEFARIFLTRDGA